MRLRLLSLGLAGWLLVTLLLLDWYALALPAFAMVLGAGVLLAQGRPRRTASPGQSRAQLTARELDDYVPVRLQRANRVLMIAAFVTVILLAPLLRALRGLTSSWAYNIAWHSLPSSDGEWTNAMSTRSMLEMWPYAGFWGSLPSLFVLIVTAVATPILLRRVVEAGQGGELWRRRTTTAIAATAGAIYAAPVSIVFLAAAWVAVPRHTFAGHLLADLGQILLGGVFVAVAVAALAALAYCAGRLLANPAQDSAAEPATH
ncbi:MAG: hypothetical protein HOV77_13875 [Hamadaea sp.]|uniref:hypothetical protein n=1 Tax=Hamadaea sp. TaxID=2024425 RepID=UPI00180F29F5|nr:hypothetical protein [Hamadaea sp.]NUT20276.1 hypothetical protein [Hamadaea sp.]